MSTEKPIESNRLNAHHSTAPKTPEEKPAYARNSPRHGFTRRFHMMPSENQAEYDLLLAQLHEDHQPATVLEAMLIERMAEHHWLIQRALRAQYRIERDDIPNFFENFNALLRYQVINERAFSRCLADFLKLRKERRKEENGFVPRKGPISSVSTTDAEPQAPKVLTATASTVQPAPIAIADPAANIGFESQNIDHRPEIGFESQTAASPQPETGFESFESQNTQNGRTAAPKRAS